MQSHTILVHGSALVSGYIGYYYNTRECGNLGLSSFNVALALLIKIGLFLERFLAYTCFRKDIKVQKYTSAQNCDDC